MSRYRECACKKPLPSGRFYLGHQACRLCGKLMPEAKRKPRKPPKDKPLLWGKEVVGPAARVFKDNPSMTAAECHAELAKYYRLTTVDTFRNKGYAAVAREKAGVAPPVGRPSSS